MRSRLCLLAAMAALFASVSSDAFAQSVTYTYDPMGRLTGSTYSTSATTSYTYDDADNRLNVTLYSGAGPVANVDNASTPLNTAATVSVLANDTSPTGYTLSVSSATPGAHGTTTVNAGSTVTYTPANAFVGTDAFNYSISDGHGGTATTTVVMTVGP